MDVISHGLWGGVAVGRRSKKDYWTAFAFGVAPDLLSFGVYNLATLLGLASRPSGHYMDEALIPEFVFTLYNLTHSLVIFAMVFGLIWLICKKPFWLMGAWALHILVDIPSHSFAFFPTPFLWPISDFKIDGIGWGNPIIFFPNLILLAVAYLVWFGVRKMRNKKTQGV